MICSDSSHRRVRSCIQAYIFLEIGLTFLESKALMYLKAETNKRSYLYWGVANNAILLNIK